MASERNPVQCVSLRLRYGKADEFTKSLVFATPSTVIYESGGKTVVAQPVNSSREYAVEGLGFARVRILPFRILEEPEERLTSLLRYACTPQ